MSLNFQQCKIFNEVQDWAKKKIKARNSNKKVSVDPLRQFITGGAGVGKSHLMKTYSLLWRIFWFLKLNSFIPTRCFLVILKKKKKKRKFLWFCFWFNKFLLPKTDFLRKRTFLEQSFVFSFFSSVYLYYLILNFYR